MPLKELAVLSCLMVGVAGLAHAQASLEPDYLCITGLDYGNVDVWLLRSDGLMHIVEADGKIETELVCDATSCQGSGFTVTFAASYLSSPEKTFAKVVREGDPNSYILSCEKQN